MSLAIHRAAASTAPMRISLLVWLLFISISATATHARQTRVNLLPKLHAGQILSYQVSYQSDKHVKAESPAVPTNSPDDATIEVHALLRLEILDLEPRAERSIVHARTRFEVLDSDLKVKAPGPERPASQPQHEKGTVVKFTILPDGSIEDVNGLDALSPDQQQAWQEWASRFVLPGVFPRAGVKLAEKVKSQEVEASPSPIAGLRWVRESTYVRNEPCAPTAMTVQGDFVTSDAQPETCAVILTTAILKQQSSPQNATPEAFKVRELRTTGTARGTNRIITYISLKTGLVVRATEEANQNMDVTIAKADAPNRVHYNIVAKSHSEVLLVAETPLTHP